MITLSWSELGKINLSKEDIAVAWLVALKEIAPTIKYLRLEASGKWTAMAGLASCGPDGLVGQSFPDDRLIVTDCAVGALIGRIGGSSATLKGPSATPDAGETKPFAIGSHTLIKFPDNAVGPMYLGFNILNRPVKLEKLELNILGGS